MALIRRTVRDIPAEVELGPDDGMPVVCAVALNNLRTVPEALLTEQITTLSAERVRAVCAALRRATAC